MNPTQTLESRLTELALPDMGITLAEAGGRIRAAETAGRVAIEVTVGFPGAWLEPWLRSEAERLASENGMTLSAVSVITRIGTHAVQEQLSPLPSVRNIIAVGSGKGGVGESTVAV